jgi:hypothetical protein
MGRTEHVPRLRFRISMSLDDFVAGPNQSLKEPFERSPIDVA